MTCCNNCSWLYQCKFILQQLVDTEKNTKYGISTLFWEAIYISNMLLCFRPVCDEEC